MNDEVRITFPCDYPIKVVGDVRPNFHEEVSKVVMQHDPSVTAERITQRTSRKGNFISISFMLVAESQEQIENLFGDLKQIESVRLVL